MAKTFFASMFCTIYTDTFSRDMVSRVVTGDEVFEFLVRDCGNSFNSAGIRIPGDYNIWYLGCGDKSGHLTYNRHKITWCMGESSFKNVENFVRRIYLDGHFTTKQFQILMDIIEEGRNIDCLYDIPQYLINRRRGRRWTKTPEAETFRNRMRELSKNVILAFENTAYHLKPAA